MAVRILIADDHEMLRNGLRLILESQGEFSVCGEAANGMEAVERVRLLKPDVVILDITMPVMDGFEAARKIRAASPDTPILVLSAHGSNEFVGVLRKIGASGYVRKSDSANILITAIEAIYQGGSFFPGVPD